MTHEYKVIPAPRRAEKAKGLKTTADRFAHALAEAINAMARDGWMYVRAEVLPCEERAGLTGRKVTDQHVLVFCRPIALPEDRPADLPPLRPADAPVPSPEANRPRTGGLSALAGIGGSAGRPSGRADTPPLRQPAGRSGPHTED
jgi:hypothetical protein